MTQTRDITATTRRMPTEPVILHCLALAGLKSAICFVDHIKAATAADDAIIAMALLK